jgi:hypothetical protein
MRSDRTSERSPGGGMIRAEDGGAPRRMYRNARGKEIDVRHISLAMMLGGFAFVGCGPASSGMDAGTDAGPGDAGTDAGPTATPGERAACQNLQTIDPGSGCASGATQSACEAALVNLRVTYAEPRSCTTQYLAWTSCLTTLAACDSGTQCPTQYMAFMICSGAP